MKAKEYYSKYEAGMRNQDTANKAVSDMLIEMCDESQKTLTDRRAKSNSALLGVLKEFNDKWNAVVALDEKKHGASVIRYNGFKLFWLSQMPLLGEIWK